MNSSILVIGDVLLDHNRFVRYERPSPENSNCPIAHPVRDEWMLGGAGNVARWCAGLMPETRVILHAHYARRAEHAKFLAECAESAHVRLRDVLERERGSLTVKERLYLKRERSAAWEQILRVDRDTDIELSLGEAGTFCERLMTDLLYSGPIKMILIADYAKGVFTGPYTEDFIQKLSAFAVEHTIPVIVNSKFPDRWKNIGVDFLVCNRKEHQSLQGAPTAARHLIVTQDKDGVKATVPGGSPWGVHSVRAFALLSAAADVTGAGDAFLAGLGTHLVEMGFRRGQVLGSGALIAAIQLGQRAAACCCCQHGVGSPGLADETLVESSFTYET